MLLFRLAVGATPLRPGIAVTAYLEMPGRALKGVTVPWSAIVHHNGKNWAYVEVSDDHVSRREVQTDHPVETGWFMSDVFKTGQHVVVTGAQMLLSEELKSQIKVIGDEDD